MHDQTHIRPVDPEAERAGGYHDRTLFLLERILHLLALLRAHLAVELERGIAAAT